MKSFDYDKDTRLRYRNKEIAKNYKEAYSVGFSFIKMTTDRVKTCVKNALLECELTESSHILDMPCGTGLMADTLVKGNVMAADMSREMMALARQGYQERGCRGFIQADATKTPFKADSFCLVVNLGLMHRVPIDIKRSILNEIASISNRYVIVSFSISSLLQKMKIALARIFIPHPEHSPCPIDYADLESEIENAGLKIMRTYRVIPVLSSQVVLLLVKKAGGSRK